MIDNATTKEVIQAWGVNKRCKLTGEIELKLKNLKGNCVNLQLAKVMNIDKDRNTYV